MPTASDDSITCENRCIYVGTYKDHPVWVTFIMETFVKAQRGCTEKIHYKREPYERCLPNNARPKCQEIDFAAEIRSKITVTAKPQTIRNNLLKLWCSMCGEVLDKDGKPYRSKAEKAPAAPQSSSSTDVDAQQDEDSSEDEELAVIAKRLVASSCVKPYLTQEDQARRDTLQNLIRDKEQALNSVRQEFEENAKHGLKLRKDIAEKIRNIETYQGDLKDLLQTHANGSQKRKVMSAKEEQEDDEDD